MNQNSSLTEAERLESLKAALTAAMASGLTFVILWLMHSLLNHPLSTSLVQFVIQGTIALFSGFLFGVTYRYIIRCDRNLQLSTGAVFAFGLIRGLAIVEYITVDGQQWVEIAIAIAQRCGSSIAESIILFTTPAILLNIAFQQGWIKRFGS